MFARNYFIGIRIRTQINFCRKNVFEHSLGMVRRDHIPQGHCVCKQTHTLIWMVGPLISSKQTDTHTHANTPIMQFAIIRKYYMRTKRRASSAVACIQHVFFLRFPLSERLSSQSSCHALNLILNIQYDNILCECMFDAIAASRQCNAPMSLDKIG